MAASEAAKEAVYLRRFLSEFDLHAPGRVPDGSVLNTLARKTLNWKAKPAGCNYPCVFFETKGANR